MPQITLQEVRQIVTHRYRSESLNLTAVAEANHLKFKEMEGLLDEK